MFRREVATLMRYIRFRLHVYVDPSHTTHQWFTLRNTFDFNSKSKELLSNVSWIMIISHFVFTLLTVDKYENELLKSRPPYFQISDIRTTDQSNSSKTVSNSNNSMAIQLFGAFSCPNAFAIYFRFLFTSPQSLTIFTALLLLTPEVVINSWYSLLNHGVPLSAVQEAGYVGNRKWQFTI